jgi:hypothetical protein
VRFYRKVAARKRQIGDVDGEGQCPLALALNKRLSPISSNSLVAFFAQHPVAFASC